MADKPGAVMPGRTLGVGALTACATTLAERASERCFVFGDAATSSLQSSPMFSATQIWIFVTCVGL